MATVTTISRAANEVPESSSDHAAPRPRRRTPLLIGSMALMAVIGASGWYLLTRGRESTDDAQVEERVVNVSPRVAGQALLQAFNRSFLFLAFAFLVASVLILLMRRP